MITPVTPLSAGAEPLPLHEALSGITGSISLVSWIFLLVSKCSIPPGLESPYLINPPAFDARAQVDSLLIPFRLQVPQVIENYRNGSAQGVSVAFVTIWLLGDIANLIGTTPAGSLQLYNFYIMQFSPTPS